MPGGPLLALKVEEAGTADDRLPARHVVATMTTLGLQGQSGFVNTPPCTLPPDAWPWRVRKFGQEADGRTSVTCW
jgi:hypothetical protein